MPRISWWKLAACKSQGTICQATPKAEEGCHDRTAPISQVSLIATPKSYVPARGLHLSKLKDM